MSSIESLSTCYICIDESTDSSAYHGDLVAFVSSFHPHHAIRVVRTNPAAIDSDVADGISETDSRVHHLIRTCIETSNRHASTSVAHAAFGASVQARLLDAGIQFVARRADGSFALLSSRSDISSLRSQVLPEWGTLNLYEAMMQQSPSHVCLGCDIPTRETQSGHRVANGTIVFDGSPVALFAGVPTPRVRQLIRAWNEGGARAATESVYPRGTGMPLTLALTRFIGILTAAVRQRSQERHVIDKGAPRTIRVRVPSIEPNEFPEFRYTCADDIQYRQGRAGAWRTFGSVDASAFPSIRVILRDYAKRVSHYVARVDTESPGDASGDESDDLLQLIREKRETQSQLLSQYHQINTEVANLQRILDAMDSE